MRICWLLLSLLAWTSGSTLAHTKHPLGKTFLDWKPDSNISAIYTMNFDFHGGDALVTWRAPGRMENRDNHECAVGPYFFFDVDDNYVFNSDETVILELLLDRAVTDGFLVSWDHSIKPTVKKIPLDKSYDQRWQSVSVELERARFANRKYGKTDFAIGALGATYPQDKTLSGEIALCDLKISRKGKRQHPETKTGILSLRLHNEEGLADSARIGLYDAQGRAPLAGQDAVTLYPYKAAFKQWPLISTVRGWPSDGRYAFYVNGNYVAEVPEGNYDLAVYKGPEYHIAHRKITVRAGQTRHIDLKLKRWANMPAKGWFSSDGHIHVERSERDRNADILAFTKAEDIHVSNLLQVSNLAAIDYFPQYAFGEAGHYGEGYHHLVSGQESPRTSHRGHTIGLNVSKHIWNLEDYFLYHQIAERIHADGGLWGYAHVALDSFNVGYGLALDVPLGAVDFLEVLQMGHLNTQYLYDFLNLGYRILPAAGSDYPYLHIAGSERIYAKVGKVKKGEDLSPKAWFDAWNTRRSFVSNGPMIEFSLNADSESREYRLQPGGSVSISATAGVNPDVGQLQKLELVVQGKVVKSVTADEAESLSLDYTFTPQRSGWLALRTFGSDHAIAHTAPVFFVIDGDTRTWDATLVNTLSQKYIGILHEFKASTPDLDEDWERFDTEADILPKWRDDKRKLDSRIDRAIKEYRKLAREAEHTIAITR